MSIFKVGATSRTIDVYLQDSSSAVAAGLGGLVYNSANLKCYYRKGATGSATSITLATQTVGGAWSSGGFVEIDATNMKGWYRFDIPDTLLAAVGFVDVHFSGATNMAPVPLRIQVVAYDPEDSVRLGLTALPNAAAQAAGGLFTRGVGAGQINQSNNGEIDVNATRHGGIVQTGRDIGASVLLSPGTGTGQILLSLGQVTVGTNNDKTGYALTGTQTIDIVGNITGSLSGSVGSVSGNVGGNVNGNLVGNVQGTLTAAERNAIADATLLRDWTLTDPTMADSGRNLLNMGRAVRNRFSTATVAGSVQVFGEDDTTVVWQRVLTTDVNAVPITGTT